MKKKFFNFNKVEYIKSVVDVDMLNNTNTPEIAFMGCSNVGKSSLINAITGSKDISRTSKTPGKTTTLNLFVVDNVLNLVDTPGYGYAKLSTKTINSWNEMMHQYLTKRKNLKKVFILINSHIGYKNNDLMLLELLEHHKISYQIILTKKDKKNTHESRTLPVITDQAIKIKLNSPIITSAKKKEGIKKLQQNIYNVLSEKA